MEIKKVEEQEEKTKKERSSLGIKEDGWRDYR